ncbi:MAG: hypothetical protein PHD36_08510 [Desulfotomaculaceae bacterium]|nr:hypothetical protein [Desulfotomaculaceae bacterium]
MKKTHVLIGSPVQQSPAILREFLIALAEMEKTSMSIDYIFMDDNTNESSSTLLADFKEKYGQVEIIKNKGSLNYRCDTYTHYWQEEIVWKVARMKDKIIEYARKNNYDYLFLIDSDLVAHPRTLVQLIKAGKEIISSIYWTCWQPGTIEMPQVWLEDQYSMYKKIPGEVITDEEANQKMYEFFNQLQIPGIYEVGGLGACTLISNKALRTGISFAKIKNLSFWGEDRHFCIRASALGLSLYVDTHYPAYHIYRESDVDGVANFKKNINNNL